MLNKLEELKQAGNYAICLYYGEGVGCDDLTVPIKERKVVVVMTPVGCLGERRSMWKGNVKAFLEFDVSTKPKWISNPPKEKEYEKDGFYIWGTERSRNE